jgi:quinolinate synthase
VDNNELKTKILELKKQKNALIIGHYYQLDEIQEVCDFVGDSYALSVIAKNSKADRIVFCGVRFMAETAKILAPQKRVFLPVAEAGCPMADMVDEEKLLAYKKEHPDCIIIGYVNTTAKVKALCDVCVTSSNAHKIIKNYKGREILYLPDQNLGRYVNTTENMNMELWPGFCCIHHAITEKMVEDAKKLHPAALVMMHPEAQLASLRKADYIGSTKQMVDFAGQVNARDFIVATERGILYELKKTYPDKNFYLLSEHLTCKSMKKTTLVQLYESLLNDTCEILIDEEVRIKAEKALNRMLELS